MKRGDARVPRRMRGVAKISAARPKPAVIPPRPQGFTDGKRGGAQSRIRQDMARDFNFDRAPRPEPTPFEVRKMFWGYIIRGTDGPPLMLQVAQGVVLA